MVECTPIYGCSMVICNLKIFTMQRMLIGEWLNKASGTSHLFVLCLLLQFNSDNNYETRMQFTILVILIYLSSVVVCCKLCISYADR